MRSIPAALTAMHRDHRATAYGAAAILAAATLVLRAEGRLWLCDCARFSLWTSDAWSAETSQQLLDPYSFTHVLHGFILWGVFAILARRASAQARFLAAFGVEALWEVVENSAAVIERFRTATAALGYTGDTVVNALGDVLCCGVGLAIAGRAGARRTALLFAAIEVGLLASIRDSFLLNVLMLIYPIEAIRQWQLGQ